MEESLLIINKSSDAQITLYLYPKWDFICWLSYESKIIPPGQKYLHRSKNAFKVKLVARFEDKPKRILLELGDWVKDKVFTFTESLHLTEEKLADYPEEKRICLRKQQRDKELKSTCGRRNLYEILGLDVDQIRKMPREEQRRAIKKGFRREIQRWHPDKNFGDDENAKEIIMAQEILLNEEKRAQYHNEADYDRGLASLTRYKAIFKPECFSEEQKRAYRHRMIMSAVSLGIFFTGIGLTAGTAGLAIPAVIAGGVFGGALTGAGFQSFFHTWNKESVVKECDKKKWLLKAGIGFVAGAAIGGAGVGITAGVAGLTTGAATVSTGQYAIIGAGTGTFGGVVSSLASDAGRKFVDGEEVTWKQALGHAVCGAAIGAAAGAVGGLASRAAVYRQTVKQNPNLLQGETPVLTGRAQLKISLAQRVTESEAEAVMGTVGQLAEERLDDSVENQSPGKHLKDGGINLFGNAFIATGVESVSAGVSRMCTAVTVRTRLKGKTRKERRSLRLQTRRKLYKDKKEHRIRAHKVRGSARYQPLETDDPLIDTSAALPIIYEDDAVLDEEESDEPQEVHIKYISKGHWISKMIVSYLVNGNKTTREVCGNGKFVEIPSHARDVEVRFQVWRPCWGDIMKYDRFKKSWYQPYEPHVFRYDTPTARTFTINGNLWWEAVMTVTDEYHEETEEM